MEFSHRDWRGVLVLKFLVGAGNMLRSDGTFSRGLDWRVVSKMD